MHKPNSFFSPIPLYSSSLWKKRAQGGSGHLSLLLFSSCLQISCLCIHLTTFCTHCHCLLPQPDGYKFKKFTTHHMTPYTALFVLTWSPAAFSKWTLRSYHGIWWGTVSHSGYLQPLAVYKSQSQPSSAFFFPSWRTTQPFKSLLVRQPIHLLDHFSCFSFYVL